MKKIFFILAAVFSISTINLKAQSGLVINVLDKIEETTLERKLDFKAIFIGLKSAKEASEFCSKMSNAHSDIQSVTMTGTDNTGGYYVDIKMKKPQPTQFYKGLFIKYGFSTIIVNGERKEISTLQ